MTLRHHTFTAVLIAGLVIAATGGIAVAQNASDNAVPATPSRSEWEQRVLRHPADTSYRIGAAPSAETIDYSMNGPAKATNTVAANGSANTTANTTARPRGVWVSAHPTATKLEVPEPAAMGPVASSTPTPVPVTTAVEADNSRYETTSGDVQYPVPTHPPVGKASIAPVPNDPGYGAQGGPPSAANFGPDGQPVSGPDDEPGGPTGGDGSCCNCDGATGPLGCWGGYRRAMRNVSIFGGVEALSSQYLGPGSQGGLGLREGFNWGGPLGGTIAGNDWREIGFQLGMAADQFNIQDNNVGVAGELSQLFVTGGFFHRTPCGGLQWGLVFDYVHDTYVVTEDLRQLRFEISFANPCCGEFGFWGTTSLGDTPNVVRATDIYTVFYRKYFNDGGGNGRAYGGFTEDGAGIVGIDVQLPLGRSWALQNEVAVLFPNNETVNAGNLQASWSLGMQLVWYPGRCAGCQLNSPFSPLQPVADNMYFVPRIR